MAGSLKTAISTLIVNVDGVDIGIIGGTLEFSEGKPVRSAKGLDNGEVIISENREEAYGMIKFEMPTTKDNISLARTLEGRSASTVSFYDDNGTEITMSSGVTKNDSSRTTGEDGKIPMEYIGTPLD